MIHSFTCKNFYSFKDEVAVSFVVNENAPKDDGYFTSPAGHRLSKIEAVVGANASGKTNLLKVLPFFKWLIVDSFDQKPGEELAVHPFILKTNEPSEVTVNFEVNERLYSYTFSLTEKRIEKEELKVTSFVNKKNTTRTLFSRSFDVAKNQYNFTAGNFELPDGFEGLLRNNASIVSIGARLNHLESQVILDYWEKMETNVIEIGWNGDHSTPTSFTRLLESLDFFNSNESLKSQAEDILRRFDLGLNSFQIEKKKNDRENTFSIKVQVKHSFGDQNVNLPLRYESSGTKQLFVLLKNILNALVQGSVAVIDEFDVNLHPDIIRALYELFVQPSTNKHNAQLLLSTQSHALLNELDKYQITLVEKDEKGESDAWRLDDVDGVRSDDNYYAKYLAGAYGAVPRL